MKDKQTKDTKDDWLPGEADIQRVYRTASKEKPSATLNARILDEARQAVAKPKHPKLFGARWAYPLSTAAVLVLSLTVVLFMHEQGVFEREIPPVASETAPAQPTQIASEEPAAAIAPESPASTAAAPPARGTIETPQAVVALKAQPSVPPELSEEIKNKTDAPSTAESTIAPGEPTEAPEGSQVLITPPVQKHSTPKTEAIQEKPAEMPENVKVLKEFRMRKDTSADAEAGLGKLAEVPKNSQVPDELSVQQPTTPSADSIKVKADVISVKASGEPGAYQFTVAIRSSDLGCQQYADWWEVVGEEKNLLFRHVLKHSHVDEQPFSSTGGPVAIRPDSTVWVRGHTNTGGYGGKAFRGSVNTGFTLIEHDTNFSTELAKEPPLPSDCEY